MTAAHPRFERCCHRRDRWSALSLLVSFLAALSSLLISLPAAASGIPDRAEADNRPTSPVGAFRPGARVRGAVGDEVELRFEIRVRLRSLRIDADLWSGGRLLMAEAPGRSKEGTRALHLVQVLEHPWKFWWVSPLVGFGEVKYAEEISLESGTWAARMRADSATQSRGRLRWEKWRREWGGDGDLDQSFAFYVIGSPRGRWRTALGRMGEIQTIENRLTHRWLPHGFSDWLAGKAHEGYGFWADDPTPPSWEPHAYHAFEQALLLLSTPAFVASDQVPAVGARWEVEHPDLVAQAREVLETLAPATRDRFPGDGGAVFDYVVEEGEGGHLLIRGTIPPTQVSGSAGVFRDGLELRSERLLVWEPTEGATGRIVSDDMTVVIHRGEQAALEIRVARQPRD